MSAERLFVLPGFSDKNKEWADDTGSVFEGTFETTVIYWPHWESGTKDPDWIAKEVEKLKALIGDRPVNLIAKSIGTYVAMKVLQENPNAFNKIVLCGIPIESFEPGDEDAYYALSKVPASKVLIIQNERDPLGGAKEVESIMFSINPDVIVSSPDADTHDYPYFEDFKKFLVG